MVEITTEHFGPDDLLYAVMGEVPSLASVAAGAPELSEVRSLVTGTQVPCWVGEGLDEYNRMAPALLVVKREPTQHRSKCLAGEVGAPMFVKYAETLVIGNKAQSIPSLSLAPADACVTGTYTQCRRAESYQGNPFTVLFSNIAHNLTYEPSAKPVGSFQRFVKAGLLVWSDQADSELTIG